MLSKLIGYTIILGAVIVKVPQILKMMQAKSAEGVSGLMFILEILGYTISASYGFVKGFPFSTYGENFPLALQSTLPFSLPILSYLTNRWIDVVILFLIASYGKKNPLPTISFSVFLAAFFVGAAAGLVPLHLLQWMQTSTIFIFSASKIPQILTNLSVHKIVI